MNNIKQNESGRTMLEMLGVLAIMGIIMYGAISGIGFGVSMYKINATYNQLEEISQGLTDLYSWSSTYPEKKGVMIKAVCDNAVTECGGSKEDPTILDEYGGISISRYDKRTDDGAVFVGAGYQITIKGLTEFACGRLKTMSYANMTVDEVSSDCGSEGKTKTLTLISR